MEIEITDSLKIRFWSKSVESEVNFWNGTPCLEWIASKNKDGYGNFGIGKIIYGAHRIAWFLFYGKLEKELSVCHHCDNPSCVNPQHLFLGTHLDNMKDRESKNRNGVYTKPERLSRGEYHYSVLHPEKIVRGEDHWAYGRSDLFPHGENHPNATLSNSDIIKIKEICLDKSISKSEIAKMFNISESYVYRILKDQVRKLG